MLNVYYGPDFLRNRALDNAKRRRDHLIRQEIANRRAAQQCEVVKPVESLAEPPKRKRGRPRKVRDVHSATT